MPSKKIKYGVIGVGKMGEFHVRSLTQIPSVSQISIFDSDQARLNEIAQKYSIDPKYIYNNISDLIANVDALSICSPSSLHYEIAKNCLLNDKHILVEKPLTIDLSQAKELDFIASEKRLALAVGHIERFNPAFRASLDALRVDGVLTFSSVRQSPFPDRISDTSVVQDMLIHDLDLVLSIAGSRPDKIEAKGKCVKSNLLDEIDVKVFFENGLLANLNASRISDKKIRQLSINCEDYIFDVDLLSKKVLKKSFAPPGQSNAFVSEEIVVEDQNQLVVEIKDFIKAIRREIPPTVTAKDAIAAIDLAEKIESLAMQ